MFCTYTEFKKGYCGKKATAKFNYRHFSRGGVWWSVTDYACDKHADGMLERLKSSICNIDISSNLLRDERSKNEPAK